MNRSRVQHLGTVLAGALLMCWPAFYNGYPLLYPDSMSYLEDGGSVARALLHRDPSLEYGRAPLYSLGILPLHLNITAWPVIVLHAILTSYVLWLVARSLLPRRTLVAYAGLVVPLCLLTGLGWLVSWIMPDVLGPALYLSIYLIVFGWEDLRPAERVAVCLITGWTVVSHASHLIVAAGLCPVLALVAMLQRRPARQAVSAAFRVVVILAASAAAQLALNGWLYGAPSLSGKRPPFLLARVITDGPGLRYLQRHCGEGRWSICDHMPALLDSTIDLLWDAKGFWQNATPAQQERLREDERPVVLGTIRAYPREEALAAAGNFWRQLRTFDLGDYDPNAWVLEKFTTVLPGARARYLRTRQVHETLHEEFFSGVQAATVVASVLVIGAALMLRRLRSPRLTALTAVIVFVVVANAAVTGILSAVEDRYQARVIWLVPLLALAFVITQLDHRFPAIRRLV